MQNKALATLYIFNGIFVMAAAMLAPIYALFAEGIGASIFQVSLLAFVFFCAKVVFVVVVGKYGDDLREKEYLLMLGFLLRATAWTLLVFAGTLPLLFAIQLLLGFGEAVGNPSFHALFAAHLDKGQEVKEYANWSVVGTITAAIGTLIGGFIVSQFGFNTLFILMSIMALISFVGVAVKPRELL